VAGLEEAGRIDNPSYGRVTDPPLDEQLWSEGYRFAFFQAVRLLEQLAPDRRPVGSDHPHDREAVRFRAYPSLKFPASEIHEIEPPREEGGPARMTVAFFGLTGPLGALPQPYTELLIERIARKDRTLRDFLDLFNHRLVGLFYRAWEKYRYWSSADRALRREAEAIEAGPERFRSFIIEQRPRLDLVSQILLDLTGLGTPALRHQTRIRDHLEPRTGIEDETFRFYSGLLAQRHRSAIGLEGMIEDYFECRTRVVLFCGRWLRLDEEDRSYLVPGGNVEVGVTAVAGERVWEAQGKFRVRLGPLGYARFCEFLPIGEAFDPLGDLVRIYAGAQFDFDVELLLRSEEAPWCRLDPSAGIGPNPTSSTWSTTSPLSALRR
jgi:type VI secretion system protein ImpH